MGYNATTGSWIVEIGDTLSDIVYNLNMNGMNLGNGTGYQKIASAVKQIASINNIVNPDKITVGQKISVTQAVTTTPTYVKVSINQFGVLSGTDRTLYAAWSWDQVDNTDSYETRWTYDTGDGVWFVGSDSSSKSDDPTSTYSIPSNAVSVKFKVRPKSKTYTVKNKETTYFTAQWSEEKQYDVTNLTPTAPSTPTVAITDLKLTASLANIDVGNADKIEFQVVKDDTTIFATGTATIATSSATYSCNVNAGGQYKVRCRAVRSSDGRTSEWSQYSSNAGTIPSPPSGITSLAAQSSTSVRLTWPEVSNVTGFEIQYATKSTYFDASDNVTSVSVDNQSATSYIITGLESGNEYFFRIRSVNDNGNSSWTEIKSVIVGKNPTAPTTWSSTTTAIVGETITLYWVHNAQDGSKQKNAQLEIIKNNVTQPVVTITAPVIAEDEDEPVSMYTINTTQYGLAAGGVIQWRVRTSGITNTYGEWSTQRKIDVYAPPTLSLSITNGNNQAINTVTSFPFYVKGLPGPNTQVPIGYHVSISANQTYETIDATGNERTIRSGEVVYSKYFDYNSSLTLELSAGNIDLENNVSYTVNVVVAMDSGLSTEESTTFSVSWSDSSVYPNAEIMYDEERFVTHIHPYCDSRTRTYYNVNYTNGVYVKTNTTIANVWGEPIPNATTTTGEKVYQGVSGATGEDIYYVIVYSNTMVSGVTLAVYRREFDGTFTELAKNVSNSGNTFITDPHPSLDYARYRIVATTSATGAVSYYDLPGYPIGESAVIIQWDESWSSFDTTLEDAMDQPPWSGSLLRLPYNIDISDSSTNDVSMVSYIGRKRPVSYYGTQLGEKSTWNMDIEKSDRETLYALRRLAIWPGDVYVREPSGSGYWANVSVSFSQRHKELTIPVTLDVTRVEGGI